MYCVSNQMANHAQRMLVMSSSAFCFVIRLQVLKRESARHEMRAWRRFLKIADTALRGSCACDERYDMTQPKSAPGRWP